MGLLFFAARVVWDVVTVVNLLLKGEEFWEVFVMLASDLSKSGTHHVIFKFTTAL